MKPPDQTDLADWLRVHESETQRKEDAPEGAAGAGPQPPAPAAPPRHPEPTILRDERPLADAPLAGDSQSWDRALEGPASSVTLMPERRRHGSSLPRTVHALMLLVDIAPTARQATELPLPIVLSRTRTLIGRHARAQIHLDDDRTIQPKHALLVFSDDYGEGSFVIGPESAEATLQVNGADVSSEGFVLASGDVIRVGSARLVFFVQVDDDA